MATTRDEIRQWLGRGERDGATFMIVACDTYSYEDYPVYVMKNTDVGQEINRLSKESMTRVMEVYSYARNLEEQLLAARAWFVD